ncbi:hypothetical protein GS416_10420 [Rhodococcus hoagii]|nr:hypothetical protein [Prescottella equi]
MTKLGPNVKAHLAVSRTRPRSLTPISPRRRSFRSPGENSTASPRKTICGPGPRPVRDELTTVWARVNYVHPFARETPERSSRSSGSSRPRPATNSTRAIPRRRQRTGR